MNHSKVTAFLMVLAAYTLGTSYANNTVEPPETYSGIHLVYTSSGPHDLSGQIGVNDIAFDPYGDAVAVGPDGLVRFYKSGGCWQNANLDLSFTKTLVSVIYSNRPLKKWLAV